MASKHDPSEDPVPLTPEEYAAAMAKFKAMFSVAESQQDVIDEEGFPAEQVLQELEEIHRRITGESS
jgi:hypothetical protein